MSTYFTWKEFWSVLCSLSEAANHTLKYSPFFKSHRCNCLLKTKIELNDYSKTLKGFLKFYINGFFKFYNMATWINFNSAASQKLVIEKLLVGEEYWGYIEKRSKCSSHLASGTIRRTSTSVNSTQEDAKNLYDNLQSILRHFAISPKSTQLLNNTLDALEMSNIHILNWGVN